MRSATELAARLDTLLALPYFEAVQQCVMSARRAALAANADGASRRSAQQASRDAAQAILAQHEIDTSR